MIGINHRLSGLAAWMTGSAIIQPPIPVIIAGAAMTYGAAGLPDIDNPDSHAGHQLNRIIPGASEAIHDLVGHRTVTHWAATGIVLGLIVGFGAFLVHPSLWWIGLAFGGGWVIHSIGDCLTWSGSPLLGPFIRRPVRPPYGWRFQVGGKFEIQVITPLMIIWVGDAIWFTIRPLL